jgi:hypothetical protein
MPVAAPAPRPSSPALTFIPPSCLPHTPGPQVASAQQAAPAGAVDKKDNDPFYGKCNARKWGQSKKIPLTKNTEFCCAHWSFDKRKSQ